MKHRNTILLAAGILLFSVSILLELVSFTAWTERRTARRFEATLQEKELEAYRLFDEMTRVIDTLRDEDLFSTLYTMFQSRVEDCGIHLLLYKADTLRFWTCNSIDTEFLEWEVEDREEVVFAGNGWYLRKGRATGQWDIVGLILIKHAFSYQNRFLQNDFQEDFRLPEGTEIDTGELAAGRVIHDSWKQPLFTLDFSEVPRYSPFQSHLSLVLFFLGILLFVLYIRHLVKSIESPSRRNSAIVMAAVILVLLNAILLKMPIPGQISSLEIFRPEQYAASDLFPALADLLITSFFIFFLVYIFNAGFSLPARLKSGFILAWQIIYAAGIVCYFHLILVLFKSLILNSSISFEAYRVLDLSSYTFVGLFILAFHFTALTILINKYFRLFLISASTRGYLFHVLAGGALVWLGGFLFPGGGDVLPALMVMSIMGTVVIARRKRPFRYSSFVMLVFLYSILSVYQILRYSADKRQDEKRILAVDLSAEHDPVAEFLLTDLEARLASDRELEFLITDGYVDELLIDDYLQQTYFTGFWDKYDLQFTLCTPFDSLYIEPFAEEWYHCYEFFDELRTDYGIRIPGSRFYFIDNMNGRISYFASFEYFSTDSSQTVTLFLELDSRLITEELGYPELLLSDRLREGSLHRDYTYAKFSNGRLITQSGNYSYSLRSNMYSSGTEEFETTISNGWKHLAYNLDPGNTIVVSSPRVGLLNAAITFTYIFVFFYLLTTVVLLVVNIPFLKRSLQLNIKNKIQYTMIGILVLSLLLIGGGTIFFSIRQYKERHNASLSEKIQSVYIEVMHKLEYEPVLTRDWQTPDYANLDELLTKFSNVFYSDINLYDPQGTLLATSRTEIFENSLIGPRMHPSAYMEISVNGAAEFVHKENIGALSYLSAYVPFRNNENVLLAFLNLPYFTRQKELTMEISNLVVAVVNFYVLLISISVLIAVFFSEQITQPLRTVQEMFGKIALGKTNAKIAYEGKDEIGNLVAEYNHMVDELALSAEKLARSEREFAWREMAKQIAHEIKNPLTPMKLSVQHLQRTTSEDPESREKSLQRITRTLIDQIDQLSTIATEFSNFAKMPRTSNEVVDLREKIIKISGLFLNTDKVQIEQELLNVAPAIVYADREQLSRVFINLIKNAIQSIPEDREGKIGVRLETNGDQAVISVMDNGRGIPEELGDRLFQPNFTTKSSGMGMGLAIVKSIIENAGGDIRYETELGRGTTFIFSLPLHHQNGTL